MCVCVWESFCCNEWLLFCIKVCAQLLQLQVPIEIILTTLKVDSRTILFFYRFDAHLLSSARLHTVYSFAYFVCGITNALNSLETIFTCLMSKNRSDSLNIDIRPFISDCYLKWERKPSVILFLINKFIHGIKKKEEVKTMFEKRDLLVFNSNW